MLKIYYVMILLFVFCCRLYLNDKPFAYADDENIERRQVINDILEQLEIETVFPVKPKKIRAQEQLVNFNAPPETNIRLFPRLSIGLAIQSEYKLEKNFDLRKTRNANRSFVEPKLALSSLYLPQLQSLNSEVFVHIEAGREFADDKRKIRKDIDKFELLQVYIAGWREDEASSSIYNMRFGRQLFIDKRQWIYDEEMDGVRLSGQFYPWTMEVFAAKNHRKNLIKKTKVDESANFSLSGAYAWNPDSALRLYTLKQFRKIPANEDPLFYGLELSGDSKRLEYWLESAYVAGKDKSQDIRAFGFDAGATYKSKLPFKPALTLGYAYGSADDDSTDSENNNFRQTGLQDNEAKLNGIVTFDYYGVLVDPELSNLSIYTVGIGIRQTRDVSLDLIYHFYRQNEPSGIIRDFDISSNPDGINKELGEEIDIVAGYRIRPHFKLSFLAGCFLPGKAFSNTDDSAFFLNAKARYTF